MTKVLALAAGGGLLGAISVSVANLASSSDYTGGSLTVGIAFLAALLIMFLCNRWSARALVEMYEEVQETLRTQLAEGLRHAPLRAVETLREQHGQAVDALSLLSSSISQLVSLVQNTAFLASMTFVIAMISLKAVMIWLLTGVVIAYWLVTNLRVLGALQSRQSHDSGSFQSHVEELLDGIKQLKLDPRAGDFIVDEIHAASANLYRGQINKAVTTDQIYLVASVLFYALGFGFAVFAPESLFGLGPQLGYEMSILLALSLGPLFDFLLALPVVKQVELAVGTVLQVLDKLASIRSEAAGKGGGSFEEVTLSGLTFRYGGRRSGEETGFTVGPINLTLRAGELVFLTGGNGSGKTTLMKMLLGLYPVQGEIKWDGRVVQGERLSEYRGLFTAIFGGQFLFDRLYGLDVERERIEMLLQRFGIADVVDFDGSEFGNLELSSGQRMRLAMVVALLEDRPVCIFDEWTANQDPKSTWMYYDELLPELIREGKTVIAVSHDDRFFDRATHLIQLEKGRVAIDDRQANLAT